MTISDDDREGIEEAIFAAHMAADQVINTNRVMYEKILDISVSEALYILKSFKEELQDDEKFENYKLHLFVPLQLHKLIELRSEKKEKQKDE